MLPFFNFAVLDPKGIIAYQERSLMITAILLMLVVVVPVLISAFIIAWKYRASKQATYTPNWDRNKKLQFTWFASISAIVLMLSVMVWKSSHALDPRQPIESNTKPITIQVVALEWKWLFIYPDFDIATVNLVQFPEDTPINFEITADAPMNSFWIPQLGGQMYAMNGMKTKLHLIADEIGTYRGASNNISGEGFAGMTFQAKASSSVDFNEWVNTVKRMPNSLSMSEYDKLARPSKNNPPVFYASTETDLFNSIIMKFMAH